MDDVTQAGEAVETSPAVEGQEEQEVVAQDEATDEVAPEEGQTDETPEVSDEADPDIVKDDTGAEFIPKKVFDARLAKLKSITLWRSSLLRPSLIPPLLSNCDKPLGSSLRPRLTRPPTVTLHRTFQFFPG